jgi:hypothetical protein
MIKKNIDGLYNGIIKVSKMMHPLWSGTGNIISMRNGSPIIIDNPVSAIMDMGSNDRLEESAIKLIKSYARGNTSYGRSFPIFVYILEKSLSYIRMGYNFGFDIPRIEEDINSMKEEIGDEESLMKIISSVFDKEDGDVVFSAFMSSGRGGNIVIESGKKVGVEFEIKDGIEVPFGLCKKSVDQPYIATIDSGLIFEDDVITLLEEFSVLNHPLVVFCKYIEHDAKKVWNLNRIINGNEVIFIGMGGPGYTDWMQDIAAVSSSEFVSEEVGLSHKKFNREWLGCIQHIDISENKSILTSYGVSDKLEQRISMLRSQAEKSSPYTRDNLLERAAELDGGLSILRVGGYNKPDEQYRRSFFEKNILYIKNSLDGVVDGGGKCLHEISTGYGDIQRSILSYPYSIYSGPEYHDPANVLVDMIKSAISLSDEISRVSVAVF